MRLGSVDKNKLTRRRFYQLALSLFTQGKHKSSNKTKRCSARMTYSRSIFYSISQIICFIVCVFFSSSFLSIGFQVARATLSPVFFFFFFFVLWLFVWCVIMWTRQEKLNRIWQWQRLRHTRALYTHQKNGLLLACHFNNNSMNSVDTVFQQKISITIPPVKCQWPTFKKRISFATNQTVQTSNISHHFKSTHRFA